MRTTLSIDDDILDVIRYLAEEKNVAMGTIVSELLRKSIQKTANINQREDFPVFSITNKAKPITPEHVKILEDE